MLNMFVVDFDEVDLVIFMDWYSVEGMVLLDVVWMNFESRVVKFEFDMVYVG